MNKELVDAMRQIRMSLPLEIRRLISQAARDLYSGPAGIDESYPGFTTACARIREVLEGLDLSDDVFENVPRNRVWGSIVGDLVEYL